MKKTLCIASLCSTLFCQVSYTNQIQPIFNANCTSCHVGGGAATLDLTSYNGVMSGGVSGLSIISGDNENSLLYIRIILPEGEAGSMPPNDPLSQEEINLIGDWINEGANNLAIKDSFLPQSFTLEQNYPNPFNPSTTILYNLSSDELISFEIFNLNGKKVRTLVNEYQNTGPKKVIWNADDNHGRQVPAGVYLYSLIAGNVKQSKKMLLVK
tara:strand:- start:1157 stop:1792 length:636 start_codon:yes stop_codon:yes gene_type:complete